MLLIYIIYIVCQNSALHIFHIFGQRCKGNHKKNIFFLEILSGGGDWVRGCPLRKKIFFLFVGALLTIKPRGGGAKGLSGMSTNKKNFFMAVPLRGADH